VSEQKKGFWAANRRAIRSQVLLGVLLVASSSLCAQRSAAVHSEELLDRSWNAWYAGSSHDPSQRDLLVEQLRLAQPLRDAQSDSEAYTYVQALFDALIQISGPVPVDAIVPFEKSWMPEILILLARAPAAPGVEEALLAMREQEIDETAWTAVNDLLFAEQSKTFLQKTIEELRPSHEFVLAEGFVGRCGGAFACATSNRHFPPGFPPVALYQLDGYQRPEAIPLIDQPIPIYYRRRVVSSNGDTGWTDCSRSILSEQGRQSLLARFVGALNGLSAEQSQELFRPATDIQWSGAAQASVEIANALDNQSRAIQALIEKAQERGLVDASGKVIKIAVILADLRADKSEFLPVVEPHEVTIP
jgi:hypothetical protein